MRFGLLTVNFSKAQMEQKKSTTKKNCSQSLHDKFDILRSSITFCYRSSEHWY